MDISNCQDQRPPPIAIFIKSFLTIIATQGRKAYGYNNPLPSEVLTLSFVFQIGAHVSARPQKNSQERNLGQAQIRNIPLARSSGVEHGRNIPRSWTKHTPSTFGKNLEHGRKIP